jgi:hypothetical protein
MSLQNRRHDAVRARPSNYPRARQTSANNIASGDDCIERRVAQTPATEMITRDGLRPAIRDEYFILTFASRPVKTDEFEWSRRALRRQDGGQ